MSSPVNIPFEQTDQRAPATSPAATDLSCEFPDSDHSSVAQASAAAKGDAAKESVSAMAEQTV